MITIHRERNTNIQITRRVRRRACVNENGPGRNRFRAYTFKNV